MSYRWIPPPPSNPAAAARLADQLNLPVPVVSVLLARGYESPAAISGFLAPELAGLSDPFAMRDMDRAVGRLQRALEDGETILVHGDFDVDGLTSTALLVRVLRQLGGRVESHLPHRLRDGYGLSEAGILAAERLGASLLITCDCGVTAVEPVRAARVGGIDTIIMDHHEPGPLLPPAVAVLDPKRPDCGYPEKELAAVGVAFRAVQALLTALGEDAGKALEHLDLVGLGTVADVVPLVGENRVLTVHGLGALAGTRKPGLRALLAQTGLEGRPVTGGAVGFILAPRLNAVGRMGAAGPGLALLLTEEAKEAAELAKTLEGENRARRATEKSTLEEAEALLGESFDPTMDRAIVLARTGWHPGVIGIVASRLVDTYYRPTVLVGLEDGWGRGSARSIPGFPLHEVLAACGEHLEAFGGHRMAAGLTVREEQVEGFRQAFLAEAADRLEDPDLIPVLKIDVEVPLRAVDRELYLGLGQLGPFGFGNPRPVLQASDVSVVGRPETVGRGHLKFRVGQGETLFPVIGFGMGDRLSELTDSKRVDLAFTLREETWQGLTRIEGQLRDFRPVE